MIQKIMIVSLFILTAVLTASDSLKEQCDRLVAQKLSGSDMSRDDHNKCKTAFKKYYDSLMNKYKVSSNVDFGEPDRTEFYIMAVKMAVLDWKEHGGWPFRSALRLEVYAELEKMAKINKDPFVKFCLIFPALDTEHEDSAVKAFEDLLISAPNLAELATLWSAKTNNASWLIDYHINNGDSKKAEQAAERVVKTALQTGFEAKGELMEHLGRFSEAEACYKEIEKRFNYVGALVSFYNKYLRDRHLSDKSFFVKGNSLLIQRLFPKGLTKVTLKYFTEKPSKGVVFTGVNQAVNKYGVSLDTVLVSLDGYLIESLDQYYYIREQDRYNSKMDLIMWNNLEYSNIKVKVYGRRFGVGMKSYSK